MMPPRVEYFRNVTLHEDTPIKSLISAIAQPMLNNRLVLTVVNPGILKFATSTISSHIKPDSLTAPLGSTSNLNVTLNKPSWCDNVQGGDFIFTPTIYSLTVRHIIAVAFILVVIITIAGNAVVIAIVFTDRPLRHITSGLVISMAICDILVALCGELRSVTMMLSQSSWAISDIWCEIFTSTDLYFSMTELLHIICLAGDRYLAICYPFEYERIERKYLISSLSISWTVPVFFSFLPILSQWHRLGIEDVYKCLGHLDTYTCTLFPNKGFSTITFVIMFIIPTLLMCFCYLRVYIAAKLQRIRMGSVTLGSYSQGDESALETSNKLETRKSIISNDMINIPELPEDNPVCQTSFIVSFSDLETNGETYTSNIQETSENTIRNSGGLIDLLRQTSFEMGSRKEHENIRGGQFNILRQTSLPNGSRTEFEPMRGGHMDFLRQTSLPMGPRTDCENTQETVENTIINGGGHIEFLRQTGLQTCSRTDYDGSTGSDFCPSLTCEGCAQSENGIHKLVRDSGLTAFEIVQMKRLKLITHRRHSCGGFLSHDFRAARSILLVFVCYAVTWTPYWLIILIMPYVGPQNIPDIVIGAGIWLAYFGSALNPFVYYFSNNAVRKGIKELVRKVLERHGFHNSKFQWKSYPE